jgi:hypothetical protein
MRRPQTWVLILAVAAVVVLAGLAFVSQSAHGRDEVLQELPKATFTFLLVGVLGVFVKEFIDRRREEAARSEALNEFRREMTRRLVDATHRVRRVPILIEADKSARMYSEQMREVTDAYLELRAVRHEIDNLGALENAAFDDWPATRQSLQAIEAYLAALIDEYRASNTAVQDHQPAWNAISELPRLRELLDERPAAGADSPFYIGFIAPYAHALARMRAQMLHRPVK